MANSTITNDLDVIDRRLLAVLQRDARTPIAALAEAAGASTASVQRRLKRLRAEVIEREAAILTPEAAGFALTALVSVELERDRASHLDGFRRRAEGEAQVLQCWCVAGETDFVLLVVARDIADYETLTRRLFYADGNVRKFKTSVVISRVKATHALPL